MQITERNSGWNIFFKDWSTAIYSFFGPPSVSLQDSVHRPTRGAYHQRTPSLYKIQSQFKQGFQLHTEKCIVPLTCILVISNWSTFWIIANRKILLKLQEYMLIQHNRTFTYSCKHGNHVRRTRNNWKGHSFRRLPALLLCVYGLPFKNA